MKLTAKQILEFRTSLFRHYDERARHELPWRMPEPDDSFDPYKIWISELMLQQTQVNRVIPKYQDFLRRFPTLAALASAELGDVLVAWQGLGYNRRAKFLWQAAQQVMQEYGGHIPKNRSELTALPGIGPNTAGAILVYAFNQPELFVETNVRSVYFHHFFADRTDVTDTELIDLLRQTIDDTNPRDFYWALMDYGTYLKRQGQGKISASKHYTKQSKFEGSLRQVRGQVIRLLAHRSMAANELLDRLGDERSEQVLDALEKEGLIRLVAGQYYLA